MKGWLLPDCEAYSKSPVTAIQVVQVKVRKRKITVTRQATVHAGCKLERVLWSARQLQLSSGCQDARVLVLTV